MHMKPKLKREVKYANIRRRDSDSDIKTKQATLTSPKEGCKDA